ncbi:hypothetical protein HNR46_002709 [Haloferula luteola]|uniref:Uncharacterized protein n=1 Tax=Haloferula luteola TaxID=595692 RepID=A0A840V4I9_9BACT|nr:hypothetical protein [Haloferula luteola]MBB5352463.1 hypothetical protein [Haloferula luteola]
MRPNPETPEDEARIFEILKIRLQEAETETRSALKATDPDHVLAEPARKLLEIHGEIRSSLLERFTPSSIPGPTRTEEDASVIAESVQIEREHHVPSSDFMDVVKALFMWRDDPVERVRQKSA